MASICGASCRQAHRFRAENSGKSVESGEFLDVATRIVYDAKKEKEPDTVDSVIRLVSSLSEDVVNVLRILGVQIEQLINLARYNPQFGAIIGIFLTNLASHKVDFLKWQHQELVCLDCASLTVSPLGVVTDSQNNVVGTILNGFLQFGGPAGSLAGFIVSIGQFFGTHSTGSGPGTGSGGNHTTAYVWVPGIIDQSANLIITGIIVASFGISAAGAIITDITSIKNIFGNTPDPTSLIKPTPPNVEAGSQVKTQQTFTKGVGPEQGS